MKKLLLTFLIISLYFALFSQAIFPASSAKIKRNEIDEFTKSSIKETNWVLLSTKVGFITETYQYKITKVDNVYIFDLSYLITTSTAEVGGNKDALMLKTTDSVFQFYPKEIVSGTIQDGKTTFSQSYYMSHDDVEYLKTHEVSKIRMYLTDSYTEAVINDKRALALQEAFKLF